MDPLSEILRSMKMRHTRVGTLQLTAPWGLAVSGFEFPAAYGMAGGEPCWVHIQGSKPLELRRGDIVLVKVPHRLLSSPQTPAQDMEAVIGANGLAREGLDQEPTAPWHVKWGGGGATTQLIGLAFGLMGAQMNPLVASLPPCILLRSESGRFPWIDAAMAFFTSEGAGTPGYTAMARLVSELVFINIVRYHLLDESRATQGWLRGLTDPAIARALQAIHESPGTAWTVGSLAGIANMSRTSFAVRFAALVEVTPIDYVTQWRMHLAAERILFGHANLTQLAFDLGYASDTAFRNTFKLRYGVLPSRFGPEQRRKAQAEASVST